MQVITATDVSKTLGISTRMLRYYEKAGLISPMRKEDYAYRCYDELTLRRLQQILVLRKLRIPLKQIAVILCDEKKQEAYRYLQEHLQEVNSEISALETIRSLLQEFVSRIESGDQKQKTVAFLDDTDLIDVVNTLVPPKSLKETKLSMNDLNNATEALNQDLRIRVVILPPMTVASYHYIGENPEENVGNTMSKFIQESHLYELKPDARLFGFNHPNPSPDRPYYGYEDCVTIPDDMEVPAPLVKKIMKGGMYATLTIEFPNFQEWELLVKWVQNNEKWQEDYAPEGEEIMGGCLEEHLNWVYTSHLGWPENGPDVKLDLLLPIKHR